ncbi:hypothetical protein [Bacillus cereus]|uniref:hypothetical protein n=1 Tax=Bacillus cereus TaxID=1396 RepID=UPI000279024C|nr:hypothetical protein [Bacillus cereus]EJQ01400.1 hypothetical protein IE1_05775 [Bacillus cereus BAG3O-2]
MKKPFYKKWWFWGIIIFFILGIAGTHDKKEKEKKNAVKEVTAEKKQEVKKEESLEDKVKKAVNTKIEEKNVESIQISDNPATEDPKDKIVLITAEEKDRATINLTKTGMWRDTIAILKELKNEKNISEIAFNYKYPMIDTYGNKSKDIVMKITLDRETLDKNNYDNLPRENLPIIAKQYWMHPGFKEK